MSASAARPRLAPWAALVPITFLAVFFAYPVAVIVARGLAPDGALDVSPLREVLGDPEMRDIAWFTVWQAALSTIVTLVLAIPGAYVLSRFRFPGRSVVLAVCTIPFVLPTVVVGSAFSAVLGSTGPLGGLGLDQTIWAILLAHAFFNYAVVLRTVTAAWSTLDPRPNEAARVLGASAGQAFLRVTLPALAPTILAAGAVVFLFTFTSFGVILILGGPHFATLETEIYRQTAQLLDLPVAAALTLVQLVAVIGLLLATGAIQRRSTRTLALRRAAATARRPRGLRERLVVGGVLASMVALIGVPLAVLVQRSFDTGHGLGLANYRALGHLRSGSILFVTPLDAAWTSVRDATLATLLAVVVGGCGALALASSRHRLLDAAFSVPLGVSAVTVGFGFLIALDEPPLDLRSSWVLVPIAQTLIAVPFVIRSITPTLRAIDPHLREVAATLGARPWRTFLEIDLPILRRALLVAAGFAFAISIGEFGATVFVARPDEPTLPVVIYRLLGQPGDVNFGAAMAASVLLMAVVGLAVLAIERFRVGPEVGF